MSNVEKKYFHMFLSGSVSIDPPSIPPQNPDMVKPPEANWSGSSFTNQGLSSRPKDYNSAFFHAQLN